LTEGAFLTQLYSKCGGFTLTNCVGSGKVLFRERYDNI